MRTLAVVVLASGLASALAASAGDATSDVTSDVIDGRTFDERTRAFLGYCAATRPRREDYPKEAMAYYVSRLILDTDTGYAKAGIEKAVSTALRKAKDRLGKNPNDSGALDPFDKHAMLNAWLVCPDGFTDETVAMMREFVAMHGHREWRGFGSMNYRLMKDGSGFVAAERWPDIRDADGLDAEGIGAATSERLRGYLDTIVHRNLDEYNAPTYYPTDLMVVRMLAEFARDPDIRRRAALTLDWMMVNLACSWNQGYNVTTAGRSKYWGCVVTGPDGPDGTVAVGWFYFGGRRGISARQSSAHHAFWMAYPGEWRLPEIVARIAREREKPFANRESVLSLGGRDIRKYAWHSTSYGLASQWELVSSERDGFFKETKRHMLKWVSDRFMSTFSIQQENFLRPYRPKDVTKNHFGYGENPFHQILQHEGAQVGVYSVPEGFPFHKMYVPFTRSGAIVKRLERDGWILCHCGGMLFAFRTARPCEWGKEEEGCDILWSDHRSNGWALETSELAPFAGGGTVAELDRFARAVVTGSEFDASRIDASPPALAYTSIGGRRLEIAFRPLGTPYTDQHRVDGEPVDYRSFPLMGNPWVRQEVDGDVLRLEHGGVVRTYDFGSWTTSESPAPARRR